MARLPERVPVVPSSSALVSLARPCFDPPMRSPAHPTAHCPNIREKSSRFENDVTDDNRPERIAVRCSTA